MSEVQEWLGGAAVMGAELAAPSCPSDSLGGQSVFTVALNQLLLGISSLTALFGLTNKMDIKASSAYQRTAGQERRDKSSKIVKQSPPHQHPSEISILGKQNSPLDRFSACDLANAGVWPYTQGAWPYTQGAWPCTQGVWY